MVMLEQTIGILLQKILSARRDIVLLACQQRAKFEGWLKFELASAMFKEKVFSQIVLEDAYISGGRSDISFFFRGDKYFVEMKTANTNWRAKGLENLTRPVTLNMRWIADDILVLRKKKVVAHGLAIFCIFPIPDYL